MHFVERVGAAAAVPVGLEQPGPQAPGLDGQALAGQLAAALAGRLVAGLLPDRPGRDGKDRAAPGPEQPARRPVRLAPARFEQPQRHVDADHPGLRAVERTRQGLVHQDRFHLETSRHPGPFGPIQGDRDPAAPAGVETRYPHGATVAHRPRSRHFLRRGSCATGGRAVRVSSWPRALSASLVIGPHMPRAAGPAPSTCVPPRFPAVPSPSAAPARTPCRTSLPSSSSPPTASCVVRRPPGGRWPPRSGWSRTLSWPGTTTTAAARTSPSRRSPGRCCCRPAAWPDWPGPGSS